jgi:hypothetical protein
MVSSTSKDGFEEAIDMMNSPSFLLMLGVGVFAILIMQSLAGESEYKLMSKE